MTTQEKMMTSLSLASLRGDKDIRVAIRLAAGADKKHDEEWWIKFAYSLLREGLGAKEIIGKVSRKVEDFGTDRAVGFEKTMDEMIDDLAYELAAEAECGVDAANRCLSRVGYEIITSDLDNRRGLRMLSYLLGKGVSPAQAGRVLRRLILALDEKRGWRDRLPFFGTGSVVRGMRRLKILGGVYHSVLLSRRFYDSMEGRFGRFTALTMELVREF